MPPNKDPPKAGGHTPSTDSLRPAARISGLAFGSQAEECSLEQMRCHMAYRDLVSQLLQSHLEEAGREACVPRWRDKWGGGWTQEQEEEEEGDLCRNEVLVGGKS